MRVVSVLDQGLGVRIADAHKVGMLAQEDPRICALVLAQAVGRVRGVAAEMKEGEWAPFYLVALSRPLQRAGMKVPIGDVVLEISDDDVVEYSRNEVGPPLAGDAWLMPNL